ncbi:MAG: 2-C-methyl-D-erythritol 4-phosphate cytidylyltransferase [Bacteroidota bacterium]|nr:2-C-methyl-D-erythritol 4-phosphate cytidylyltransferase [Bacteroidota bacterium]
MVNKIAVIVAGGSGQRMGVTTPKQFLRLHGKPLLYYTLQAFLQAFNDLIIVLVLPEEHMQTGQAIAAELIGNERIKFTVGGLSRFQSVQNGLKLASEDAVIFVHDGVRCLITPQLIRSCFEQALLKGSAIPAVAATDSIRIIDGDKNHVADRNNVRLIQTPQTFKGNILLPAFQQGYKESFTDEATVVEATGTPVFLIEGDYQNIKVTRPIDLLIAEKILEERKSSL